MVDFLIKRYIKNYEDVHDPEVRNAYGKLCGIVGIGFNIILFIGKLVAGLISSSISAIADAVNNLSDAGSSLISYLGFRLAGQKPDPEHPFGHGRYEYISGLIVSMVIVVMGVELFRTSINKIINPSPISFNVLSFLIMIFSLIIKLYMAFYNTRIGKRINSYTVKATALDSLTDCIATSFVVISMVVEIKTGIRVDGFCGLIVAGMIVFAGIKSAKATISPLLGQPADAEFVNSVEKIVRSNDMILGIHDLVVHDYGPGRKMISLHAEVPASGDILEMHDLIDNIEHELDNKLSCHSVIHMDPIDKDNVVVQRLRILVENVVKGIDPSFTIHDFRVVSGPTHSNLLFDVVVPFNHQMSDSEIKNAIQDKVQEENPQLVTVIQIDKSFCEQ